MDAPGDAPPSADREREHLARAHYEICTALTVFCSNVELIRSLLRDTALPGNGELVHEHLDELNVAVARLHEVANDMKRWHDAAAPRAQRGGTGEETALTMRQTS